MSEFIVIGAGIMGLMISWELVQKNHSVSIIEKSEPGKEASWAGGGIVSPLYPWRYSDPITQLAQHANHAYPYLAEKLLEETGIESEYNHCGLYMLDSPQKDQALTWSQRVKNPIQEYPIDVLREEIPHLNKKFKHALSMPHVGNIRNPRLLRAFHKALENHHLCQFYCHSEAQNLLTQHQTIRGVQTSKGPIWGDQVIVCSGAWTSLLSHTLGFQPEIKPIKGEMLVLSPSKGLVKNILLYQGKYLIPRLDGRIVIGSTLDDVGFDKQTTSHAQLRLLTAAYDIVPELEKLTIEKHWAGLRPGSPGGIPYIGESPEQKGLWVCAGHFRNGLVLAPGSINLLKSLLFNEHSEIDPAPFRINSQRSEKYI